MSLLTICLIICVLTIAAYVWGKFPMGSVALTSMIAFIITGCITPEEALANFGNSNAVMLLSMFVVAAGFNRTQFVHNFAAKINSIAKGSLTKIMAGYILAAIVLSQFIQSPMIVIGIVAPMLIASAEEIGISPSKVVFPLGVAAISTCSTLPLGSGATVFAELNGYLQANAYTTYMVDLLDPMKARLPLLIICAIYCIFFATKLAPDQPSIEIIKNEKAKGGNQ